MMKTPKIKRPPFDFEIPEDLEDTINESQTP